MRWVSWVFAAGAVFHVGCQGVYEASCGAPGTVSACLCPSGLQGTQRCEADGSWSDGKTPSAPGCNCDAPVEVTAPELGGSGTPPIGIGAGSGSGGIPGGGGQVGSGGQVSTGGAVGAGGQLSTGGAVATGGQSGTGGGKAPPAPWGDCDADADCRDGSVCRSLGAGAGRVCAAPCMGGADACPAAPNPGARVTCQATFADGGRCAIACAGSGGCPDGMRCFLTGFSGTCGW